MKRQLMALSCGLIVTLYLVTSASIKLSSLAQTMSGGTLQADGHHNHEAFIESVRDGKLDLVERFLTTGTSPNTRDTRDVEKSTVLMVAAMAGRNDVVELLISNGADVNARTIDGRTALMWAAWKGHLSTVNLLLARGADVNNKDVNGSTALLFATSRLNSDTVKALLNSNPQIDSRDQFGRTALMVAVAKGSSEILRDLVSKGADVQAKDREGRTAVSRAIEKHRVDLKELLQQPSTEHKVKTVFP